MSSRAHYATVAVIIGVSDDCAVGAGHWKLWLGFALLLVCAFRLEVSEDSHFGMADRGNEDGMDERKPVDKRLVEKGKRMEE